jgi:hypothetical protein
MAAPHITVTFNHARGELLKEGWGVSRVASAFQYASNDGNLFLGLMPPGALGAAPPPEGFQLMPGQRIVRMRPDHTQRGFEEDSLYDSTKYAKSELEFGDPDQFLEMAQSHALLAKRTEAGSHLIESLTALAIAHTLALEQIADEQLVWAVRTQEVLKANEGIVLLIDPSGTTLDRAQRYAAVMIGDEFYLGINLNGMAEFWQYSATDDPEVFEWVMRETIPFGEGGIHHQKGMIVELIPWGASNIQIRFATMNMAGSRYVAGTKSSSTAQQVYDIDLSRYGFEPSIDPSLNQVIKTQPAKAYVALRQGDIEDGTAYAFRLRLSRVRYQESATFDLLPEALGETKTPAPQLVWRGFADFTLGGNPTQPQIGITAINEMGAAYVPGTSTYIGARVTMDASADRVYSPELWYWEGKIAEETHTPAWTPLDMSAKWTYLRIQRKASSEPCHFQGKFKRDSEYLNLFKSDGPIRVTAESIDGTTEIPLFEGYPLDRKPTLGGSSTPPNPSETPGPGDPEEDPPIPPNLPMASLLIEDEIDALDGWHKLNNTPIRRAVSIEGKSVGTVLEDLLNQAGYPDSELRIEDDLYDIEIPGFTEPNALRVFAVDAFIGDGIKELIKPYGLGGYSDIRVRQVADPDWVDPGAAPMVWSCYLAPIYDSATPPTKAFYLDSSLIPSITHNEGEEDEETVRRTDQERWEADPDDGMRHYISTSTLELTIRKPDFNGLIARASTGTGEGADGLVCFIAPDPRVLDDPDYILFEGQVRGYEIGPPEVTCQTYQELERIARRYYDRAHEGLITTSIGGEFQPEIDADEFIAILGRNPEGEPVSYGAWRIIAIDAEIREDHGNTRWSWYGNYALEYVGATPETGYYAGFPMFTTILP